jgi:hypothetical protein
MAGTPYVNQMMDEVGARKRVFIPGYSGFVHRMQDTFAGTFATCARDSHYLAYKGNHPEMQKPSLSNPDEYYARCLPGTTQRGPLLRRSLYSTLSLYFRLAGSPTPGTRRTATTARPSPLVMIVTGDPLPPSLPPRPLNQPLIGSNRCTRPCPPALPYTSSHVPQHLKEFRHNPWVALSVPGQDPPAP